MDHDVLGYVVVEWNQASGQPNPNHGMALTDDLEWARELASAQQNSAQGRGRGERYTVHAVVREPIEAGGSDDR
jgi:hypothetical protein